VPSPTPAIRYRPIAKMDARYLCPVPSNLCWGLKEQFEAALKTRTDWESYQKHRADFLVDEGVKTIAAILPGSQAFQNLTYVADDSHRQLQAPTHRALYLSSRPFRTHKHPSPKSIGRTAPGPVAGCTRGGQSVAFLRIGLTSLCQKEVWSREK